MGWTLLRCARHTQVGLHDARLQVVPDVQAAPHLLVCVDSRWLLSVSQQLSAPPAGPAMSSCKVKHLLDKHLQ